MEPLKEESYKAESVTLGRKEWLRKEIRSITSGQIKGIIKRQYAQALGFAEGEYETTRGVHQLLDEKSHDYARLPPLNGQSALEIFRSLPPGSEWLDLGCGSGTFIVGVLKDINFGIKAAGFDARTWRKQEGIPELVLGDIDRIDKSLFPAHPEGFDLITSASVFYHLPDYWGALVKSVDLLKPNGKVILSTICRPMRGNYYPIDNESGDFVEDPGASGALYYENRNTFDTKGRLMSIADAVQIFNSRNPGFKLEYHSGPSERASHGDLSFGGGFSGRKLGSDSPVDASFIFYCLYPEIPEKRKYGTTGISDLSFIFARTTKEAEKLRKQGFVSVQDRIK